MENENENENEKIKSKGRYKKHPPLNKFNIEVPPSSKNFISGRNGENFVRIEKMMGSDCSKYLLFQNKYLLIKYKKEDQLNIAKKEIGDLISQLHSLQPRKYFKRVYFIPKPVLSGSENTETQLSVNWKKWKYKVDTRQKFLHTNKHSFEISKSEKKLGNNQEKKDIYAHHHASYIPSMDRCIENLTSFVAYQICKNENFSGHFFSPSENEKKLSICPKISIGKIILWGNSVQPNSHFELHELMDQQKPNSSCYWYFSHSIDSLKLKKIQSFPTLKLIKNKNMDLKNNLQIQTIQSKSQKEDVLYYSVNLKNTELIDIVEKKLNVFEDFVFPKFSNLEKKEFQDDVDLRLTIQARLTSFKNEEEEELGEEIEELLFDEEKLETENYKKIKSKSRRISYYQVSEEDEDLILCVSETTNHLNGNFKAYEVGIRSLKLEEFLKSQSENKKPEEFEKKMFFQSVKNFIQKSADFCNDVFFLN